MEKWRAGPCLAPQYDFIWAQLKIYPIAIKFYIVPVAKVLRHCSKPGIPNPIQTMQYIGDQPDDMKPVFTALQGITQIKVRRVA
ncbi:MAG: hypothetical protein ACLQQ4_13970 [Bacteroidia bacterium]